MGEKPEDDCPYPLAYQPVASVPSKRRRWLMVCCWIVITAACMFFIFGLILFIDEAHRRGDAIACSALGCVFAVMLFWLALDQLRRLRDQR